MSPEERVLAYYRHLFPALFSSGVECSPVKDMNREEFLMMIRRGWESQPEEFNYECKVEGTIPREISGTFYRNGPGLLDVYGTPLVHPIDGDGMVLYFISFFFHLMFIVSVI